MERLQETPEKAHERRKRLVTLDDVHEVEAAEGPLAAANILCQHHVTKACAILDRMSPFGAAFVFAVLRTQMANSHQAAEIVKMAETLELRAVKGFCEARQETYEKTGIWLP